MNMKIISGIAMLAPRTIIISMNISRFSQIPKINDTARARNRVKIEETPANRTVDLEAVLTSPSAFEHDDWELQTTVDARLGPTTKATVDAKLNATGKGGIDHLIEAKFSEAKIAGTAILISHVIGSSVLVQK